MADEIEPVIAPATTTEVTPTVTDPKPDEFSVPDAYKEKGWAKNIKSNDDAWKMLDNAQSLAGKKTVAPDWDKATPKEIEDYYAQLRPADKSAYQFDEGLPDEMKTAFSDMLHKHGISAKQGNDLIKDYMAVEQATAAKMYDKDGFMAELKTSFGNDYEKVAGDTAKILASHLNENDKALLDKIPNQYLGVIYRVAANLNKAYGASESGSAASAPSTVSVVDVEKRAGEIRNEIIAISRRQHTAEEKQKLVDELSNLYKKG